MLLVPGAVPSKPKAPPPKVVVVKVPDEDRLNVAPADNVKALRLTVVEVPLTTALITLSPEVKAVLAKVWADVLVLPPPLTNNVPPPMDKANVGSSKFAVEPKVVKSSSIVPALMVSVPLVLPNVLTDALLKSSVPKPVLVIPYVAPETTPPMVRLPPEMVMVLIRVC